MAERDSADLEALIEELAAQFRRQGLKPERYQTHISSVLLAGEEAYKFKQPVDFGFLDFHTFALRAHFCRCEVALNQRFAPALYRDVVAITRRDDGQLALNGTGAVLEYAVWMRRFDTSQQLDHLLDGAALEASDFDELGQALGALHASAARADPTYGTAQMSLAQMRAASAGLSDLEAATSALLTHYAHALNAAESALAARHDEGFIRDCHGDLHLSNIVRYGGRLLPFDCIEFNDELRYIDTLNDFAFLFMDLELRGATDGAYRVLNAYLATTGDYAGLTLLALYAAYRSLVRAKVALLARGAAPTADSERTCRARATRHLELAQRYLMPRPSPTLTITHGLSGSGKSWRSRQLAAQEGQIHLRSDVERRRLAGIEPLVGSGSTLGHGIYAPDSTSATYARLQHLSRLVLGTGYSVMVDAAFLHRSQRAQFQALADELGVRFQILDCAAPLATLQARIRARAARRDDPSEATLEVLAQQLATREPLTPAETQYLRRDAATSAQSHTDPAADA